MYSLACRTGAYEASIISLKSSSSKRDPWPSSETNFSLSSLPLTLSRTNEEMQLGSQVYAITYLRVCKTTRMRPSACEAHSSIRNSDIARNSRALCR